MRVVFYSFLLSLYFLSLSVIGQISVDLLPLSSKDNSIENWIESQDTEVLPAFDLLSLKEEDSYTDQHKDIPWRFGEAINVNFNLTNSGTWTSFPDGSKLWVLKLKSAEAQSLNFNFKKFHLPSGSMLHIYKTDRSEMLGAFTDFNNRKDSLFATTIIKAESVIFEYYQPSFSQSSAVIELESVVHGYREISNAAEGLNNSGNCNINVNCPEGLNWQNEKRAVVMILLANNTRVCSGTLINNLRHDGRPFVLTANHCPINSTNVFVFNYDSPNCAPSSEPSLTQSISGCTELANNSSFFSSDFNLVELSNQPPSSYNSYYAGWSSIDEAPRNSAGIHHPRGDVKKIALDFNPAMSSGYYTQGDNHWAVLKWDKGTTEDASSGSALFNEQKRIVGQLHGGDASCTSDTVDFYGKFSTSWNSQPDSTDQLKYWLDPDGSDVEVLDGYDPNLTLPQLDVQVLAIGIENETVCGDSIYPLVKIRNGGSSTLTSFTLSYFLDGVQAGNLNWTGSLSAGNLVSINIPALAVETGNHQFEVKSSQPNGGVDQRLINDFLYQQFFNVDSPVEITLTVKTDDFGNETKWQLVNLAGTIVESFNNYPGVNGGGTYTHQFCLYSGCYNFVILDTYGDGFCCGSGQGSYLLQNTITGDTIDFNNSFSDFADTTAFCVGDSCTILAQPIIQNSSESGKSDGSIEVNVVAGNPPFTFSWSTGANSSRIENLAAGTYQLTITDSLGCSEVFSFSVQISTGIAELSTSLKSIIIYPNPASEFITISNSDTSVRLKSWNLYDLNGKKLRFDNQSGMIQLPIRLDLSALNNGLYFIEFIKEDGLRETRKLIIQ